ncbi:ankyrin [Vararia minispora EC-137]|uniref:Ankyrin n=1 Tax=Vararia minispora EC-137 TaxID=1314806 RepID=A0ACB8QNQ0_9AGAM|nr:ankyrin [Vararia minispora EC-137]
MAPYTPSPTFHEAAVFLSSSSSLPRVPNAVKLELYALFKLLTVATVPNTSRPSIFDIAGRAKWDAWARAGKDYDGRLPDAEGRYIEVARGLGYKEGASVEQPVVSDDEGTEDGETSGAGHWHSDGGGEEGFGISVSKFAAPEADDDESSELHRLAVEDDAFSLCNLIDQTAGLDVNERDQYGYTALHLAADRGHLTTVKALIAKGADATLKDPDEMNALDLAKCAGHDEIVALLEHTTT